MIEDEDSIEENDPISNFFRKNKLSNKEERKIDISDEEDD